MGNDLLKLAVIGGAVLLAVFAAYAVAVWYARRGCRHLSAACGRAWGRACECGGRYADRLVEAFGARTWTLTPELVRAS